MAKKSNKYEKQARFSIILAVIGGLAAIAATVFVLQRFDPALGTKFDPDSWRQFAILSAVFCALAAGAVGFFIAFDSAGQRRNKLSRLSWTGFFLNAGVITLALAVGVFFYYTRYTIAVGPASQ